MSPSGWKKCGLDSRRIGFSSEYLISAVRIVSSSVDGMYVSGVDES